MLRAPDGDVRRLFLQTAGAVATTLDIDGLAPPS